MGGHQDQIDYKGCSGLWGKYQGLDFMMNVITNVCPDHTIHLKFISIKQKTSSHKRFTEIQI